MEGRHGSGMGTDAVLCQLFYTGSDWNSAGADNSENIFPTAYFELCLYLGGMGTFAGHYADRGCSWDADRLYYHQCFILSP